MESEQSPRKPYQAQEVRLPDIIVGTADAFADPAIEYLSTLKANQPIENFSLGRFSAAATSLTLACELYLKALFRANGVKPPWGHELWPIYEALPVGVQAYIEHAYAASTVGRNLLDTLLFAIGNRPPDKPLPSSVGTNITLEALLKANGDAFSNWRYVHEVAPPLDTSADEGVLMYDVARMVRLASVLKDMFARKDGRVIGTHRYKDEYVLRVENPAPSPVLPLPPQPLDEHGNIVIDPASPYPPPPRRKRKKNK